MARQVGARRRVRVGVRHARRSAGPVHGAATRLDIAAVNARGRAMGYCGFRCRCQGPADDRGDSPARQEFFRRSTRKKPLQRFRSRQKGTISCAAGGDTCCEPPHRRLRRNRVCRIREPPHRRSRGDDPRSRIVPALRQGSKKVRGDVSETHGQDPCPDQRPRRPCVIIPLEGSGYLPKGRSL